MQQPQIRLPFTVIWGLLIYHHFMLPFRIAVILYAHSTIIFWMTFVNSLHGHCLYDSVLSSLPEVHQSSAAIPGWNAKARQLKEKANFWHILWRQSGCLSSGVLHQIKTSARSRYRCEVRRLKRREQFIRHEKMAAAIASSNSKSFWQQVIVPCKHILVSCSTFFH